MKIMKHDTFSRCNKCTTLSSIIQNTSAKPQERAEAMKLREVHWQRVTTERRYVYEAEYNGMHDDDYFFCEVDGMDSSKTIIPHFHRWSKDVDKEKLLKVHITCVKHAGNRPCDVYYFTDAFPHDSANTITVLYKTLLKEVERRGKPLKIAHFQLDNTSRENKNKYVVAWAQLMVHLGLCREIRLSFLPVG